MRISKRNLLVPMIFCLIALSVFAIFTILITKTVYAETITLPQGLRLAVENNREIRIARDEELISNADTRIERSKLLPEVNANASQTFLAREPRAIFGAQTVPVSQKDYYAYNLIIQHTLYDFRKNASLYESSKAILNTKIIDTSRIRNLVALQFGLAYFDLLESDKMLDVAKREVERIESHLKDARNLYEEGVITKNDLLQAEVRISDARQRLSTAANQRAINVSRLNKILVRPLTSDIDASDTYITDLKGLSMDILRTSPEEAWKIAERQRPEILIADETYRSLNLQEKSKKAEYLPRFFAQGGYDFTQNRYMIPAGNWTMILGMSINLYSGGKTKAEIEKIEAEKKRVLEQKDNLIDQIRLDLEQAILNSRTANERVAVTKDAVQQAEENLRINRVRYEEGVGTATEVLDAVTLLTVAETNYNRAVYDLSRSEAAVLYSTGMDLSEIYQ